MRLFWLVCLWCISTGAWAAHAYAQFGDIKYPPGFSHFEYVNPDAPKGGQITLVPPTRISNFDKYNPFTLKGTSPPGLSELLFESLLTGNLDEPTTAYGLLAEDVEVAPDKLSATFRLNPKARFHNGDPVLAIDVKDSFDRLMSKEAAPGFRAMFAEIKGVTVLDQRTVRFDFKRGNAELPLLAGQVPIFSHKWGLGPNGKVKPFDKIIMDQPIATGPYRVGHVNFGKDVTYQRNPNYWAKDLNVRKGQYNFDRITQKIYADETAKLEAFKAGEFDYIQVFSAREWARQYIGPKFDKGELIRRNLPHRNAGDFQGFFINTRLPKFKDVRVRQAIELAMDFEWMNRQLFFNAYTRVRGYFVGGDFEAKGLPGADELALLEPLRRQLPPEVFTQPVPQPPSTAPPGSLRSNLRQARQLLADAGWTYRDGALRNAKGEPFELEFLDDSGSMSRVVTPYIQNLAKLGIEARYKVIDFALLQKRVDVFDFELITNRLLGNLAPGTELLDRFSSKAASVEGSSNMIGVKDPAVDALLEKATGATTRPELIAALRSLDRVLRFGHYVVPHWYASTHRVAYWANRFDQPKVAPLYYQPEGWVLSTWWALPGK
ncbi:MAG: ABC transporter substrate-binding protein [Rubrivivax sp.]|nr:MAG: ABC transporter substrate-binding protein [Rubrivivax sp.]